MPTTRTLPRRALLLGVAALIATLSCGREVTGPADGVRYAHGFAFLTRFADDDYANAVASDLVPYTKVRVLLHRSDGRVAVDRVVDFPSDAPEVRLTLSVELSEDAPPSGEVMDLSLRYMNAAGDTVFKGGPTPVTLVPSRGDEVPEPVGIDVDYSGPGSSASAIFISPSALSVGVGEPFEFTATVLGPQEQLITDAPIAWSSLDPTIATITAAGAGAGVATQTAGTARIVAQLLNGPADTVLLTVTPPTGPDVIVFTAQPTTTVAGEPIGPVTVEVRDFQGALRTDYNGVIGIALGANPGDDGLEGTTIVNAVAGVATFTDLQLHTAIAGYTLVASSEGLAAVTSDAFAITHAAPAELLFDQGPSNAFANATITPAVVVRVIDGFDNLATTFVGEVTMDLAVIGDAQLGGTRTVAVTGGFATFADLTIDLPGEYALTAGIGGVGTVTSATFLIAPAPGVAVEWTNPAGGNWSVGTNWSTGVAPTASDSVAIALDGTYTVTLDVNTNVRALTVGGGTGTRTLALGIRTLGVTNWLAVLANAGLTVSSGTITGTAGITNDGTIELSGSSIPLPIDNRGLLIARGTSSLTAGVTTGPLSVIRALGASVTGTGALSIFGGLANNGIIELTSIDGGFTATLTVTDAPLINAASGMIRSLVGLGGGRTLAAALQNSGTVQVDAATTLAFPSALHVNDGTLNVAGGNLTVTQSGTTPLFTNSGTININAGRTLTVNAGALDLTSGTVNGGEGTLVTNGVAMTFQVPEVRTRLQLNTTTVTETVTIAPTDSLVLVNGSPTIDLINEGLLITQGTTTLNGTLVTDPSSTLRVRGASVYGTGALTITHDQSNSGTIQLTSIEGGFTSTLTVQGTLTNLPTGSIVAMIGAGGGRTITTQLDNQGVLGSQAALTLTGTDVAQVNSGTIVVTTGNFTVTQTAAGSFANTGTIALDAGRVFTVNGGALDLTGGEVNGYAAQLTRTNGPTTFTVPEARTRLAFTNSVIQGTFTIPAADSLLLIGGDPTFDLVNEGLLITQGTVSILGTVTTTGNDTIRVRGASVFGTAALTLPAPFTNTGTIELTSINGGFTASLTVNGTFTNAATGEVVSEVGAGGGRTIDAELHNQGLLRTPAALTLTRAGATHQNPGTIAVTGGNLTVTQTAGGFFLNPGTITLDPGRVLTVNNGTLTLTGGQVNGGLATLTTNAVTLGFTVPEARTRLNLVSTTVPGTFTIPAADSIVLVNASPTMNLVNQGVLIVQGTTTLSGSITTSPNDTIRVRGASVYGTAALTIPGSLTNNGVLELTSIDGGFTSSITVDGGLVNSATGIIDVLQGAGGGRTIAAQLQNSGDINVRSAVTLSRTDAAQANDGTIDLTTGNMTVAQSPAGSFANTGVITMDAGRVLSVTGGALDLTGGQVNGYAATLTTNGTTMTFTVPQARTRLNLVNTTVPGTFTIPAADSLILVDASPTFTLVNEGLLVTQGTTTLNGTLTTTGDDTLRVRGASVYGTAALTLANPFTNTGTVELTSVNGGFTSTLSVPGGLTNAPSGIIDILVGAGGGRTIAAQLDNQGIINGHAAWTLAQADAQHVNNGSIHVFNGQFSLTQTGAAPSFTNLPAGVIEIAPTQVMAVNGGALDLTLGMLDGGMGTLRMTNAQLSFTVPTAVARLDLDNTIVPHTVIVPAGDSLVLVDGTLNAPIENSGTIITMGNVTLGGAITTADPGSVIMPRGAAVYGTSNLTVTNGFTNTATLRLTSIDGGFTSTLGVTNGTLVNAPSGTIESLNGAGGGRTIAAQLDNQGALNIGTATTLALASAQHANSGTITLGGNLTVTQTGTTPSFTNLGTIVANANAVTVNGGTLDLTAGTLTGTNRLFVNNATYSFAVPAVTIPMTLTNTVVPHTVTVANGQAMALVDGTLNAPINTNGDIVLNGDVSLGGAITTGPLSNLRVLGASGIGNAAATIVNGFTNNGTLELGAVGGGFTSGLSITTGTLVNAEGATFNVSPTNGGGRSFTGALIQNAGTINVGITFAANTALDQAGGLNITAGTTTTSGLVQLFANSSTIVSPGATFVKNGGCQNQGNNTLQGTTCP